LKSAIMTTVKIGSRFSQYNDKGEEIVDATGTNVSKHLSLNWERSF
jgi:hypothetical protein